MKTGRETAISNQESYTIKDYYLTLWATCKALIELGSVKRDESW